MQALAQTGLAFSGDPYDRDRYRQLQALAAEVMARHSSLDAAHFDDLFSRQAGYATPKLGVRGAIFRDERILLVREIADEHRWSLPGGWADVNESPSGAVAREVREETGLEVRPYKLAAVWDRSRHPHTRSHPFQVWRLFFLCEITGGALQTGPETSELAFFAEDALPADLSTARILPAQVWRMFEHRRRADLPTEFD